MNRPRVVFDCNALLQSLISETGPAAEALRLMERNVYDLQISRDVLKEFQAVLHYEALRQKNPEITDDDIEEFLHRLLFRATLVRRVPAVFSYPRAPQDEPYINLAIASKAHYLVTRDTDLLSFMTGHTLICKEFRKRTHPLEVVNPVEFLRLLPSWQKP